MSNKKTSTYYCLKCKKQHYTYEGLKESSRVLYADHFYYQKEMVEFLPKKEQEELNKMEQTNETEQPTIENWLKKEVEQTKENKFDGEMLPSLQLEEGKLTEFEVDFSKPFDKWEDTANNTVKKIIPVIHEGELKNFWLNVRNPLYSDLVSAGLEGKTKFQVMRTGTKKQTRYSMVKK